MTKIQFQPPLSALRVMHTQPRMALVHDLPPFVGEGRLLRMTVMPPTFREEVAQILNEITLDEWTHPALDKIEDALLKGEE